MTSHNPCPQSDRLPGLLGGTLPAAEQSSLSSHLETCHDCQQTLETLTRPSPEWAAYPGQTDPSMLRELVQVLQAEGSQPAGSDGAVEAVLALLTPAQRSDSLGRLGAYDVMEV